MSAGPSSVEAVLREAIATAHAQGWVLRPCFLRYVTRNERSCCALGAVLVAANPSEDPQDEADFDRVAERLGIGFDEAVAISEGFDNAWEGNPWRELGNALRRWVTEQGFALRGGAS